MSWNKYIKKIIDVCEVIAGQSPEGKYYNKDGEGLPFYQGKKEFTDREIGEPTTWTKKTTKEAFSGDILLSVRAPVGPINLCTQHICIGRGLAAIRASEKVNREYLFYYLLKHEAEIVGNTGAVFNSINKTQIGNIPIPIPPLPEQQQIVAILDKAFEVIDQAKANIEKNIENAKELFQSKLNNIFSQKGEGWEEKTILELCEHKSQIVGGPFGSNLKVKDYKETGVPILRLQNIGKGYFIDKNIKYINDEKAKELDYHSFVSGDIALAKLGIPIGKTCIIPEKFKYGIVTADVVRIRPNKEKINYSFLKHFLNSQSAVQQLTDDITGATRPRVNMAEVRNLKLSVPSKEIQVTLNNIIDGLETDINNVISNYEKKNMDLEELKKSILQKAFAGELTQKTVEV